MPRVFTTAGGKVYLSNGKVATDACSTCCAPITTGACCLPDDSCQVMHSDDCSAAGGTFEGEGTTCTGDCFSCIVGFYWEVQLNIFNRGIDNDPDNPPEVEPDESVSELISRTSAFPSFSGTFEPQNESWVGFYELDGFLRDGEGDLILDEGGFPQACSFPTPSCEPDTCKMGRSRGKWGQLFLDQPPLAFDITVHFTRAFIPAGSFDPTSVENLETVIPAGEYYSSTIYETDVPASPGETVFTNVFCTKNS